MEEARDLCGREVQRRFDLLHTTRSISLFSSDCSKRQVERTERATRSMPLILSLVLKSFGLASTCSSISWTNSRLWIGAAHIGPAICVHSDLQ